MNHYINDTILTGNDLAILHKSGSLLEHLKGQGWAVKHNKVQEPWSSVRFLGVLWSNKTKLILAAVLNKIQNYSMPKSLKQLQAFLKLLLYWRIFISYLSQLLMSLV